METWEKALEKFIAKWENKPYVTGAIVCGSYVTGRPSRHSDIDIQIFLDKSISWRERGNEIVDGFLMEYFANPLPQNLDYFREDYERRRKYNIHMFTSGRVLFDKNGDVVRLIKEARKWDKKKFKRPGKTKIELDKYRLWDLLDNLEEVYESNHGDFDFVYHNSLNELFECYSSFLAYHAVPASKLMRFLSVAEDRKKYGMPRFLDKVFSTLFIKAIKAGSKKDKLATFQTLYDHAISKMGDFDINGWKVRSPAKK